VCFWVEVRGEAVWVEVRVKAVCVCFWVDDEAETLFNKLTPRITTASKHTTLTFVGETARCAGVRATATTAATCVHQVLVKRPKHEVRLNIKWDPATKEN
jgi:hypothetical protein